MMWCNDFPCCMWLGVPVYISCQYMKTETNSRNTAYIAFVIPSCGYWNWAGIHASSKMQPFFSIDWFQFI